jgi:hypothetical protein
LTWGRRETPPDNHSLGGPSNGRAFLKVDNAGETLAFDVLVLLNQE